MLTSFKRWMGALLTLVVILSPSLAGTFAPQTAQAATINTYIKGSEATVYWYASNGKRYVLPNAKTFYSWVGYGGVPVTTVNNTELYGIPLGGNVTYRPGARLVKIATDPKVYAVSRYGVLRWVSSELVARTLYGDTWAQMVDDVPVDYFSNYTMGNPIYSSVDYTPSIEYTSVTNPNDNISSQSSVGGSNTAYNPYAYSNPYSSGYYSSTIELSANRTSLYNNETNRSVTLSATIRNPSIANDRLRIRVYDYYVGNGYSGTTVGNCEQTTTCTFTVTIPTRTDSYTQQYVAVAEDRLTGQPITNNASISIPVYGSSGNYNSYYPYNNNNTYQGGAISLNVDRTSLSYNDSNRTAVFIASVNTPSLPTERVRIQFVNETTNRVERTCNGVLSCSFTYYPDNANGTVSFHAEYRDRENNAYIASSNQQTLTIYGNSSSGSYGNRFSSSAYARLELLEHVMRGSYDVARMRVRLLNAPSSLSGISMVLSTDTGSVGYATDNVYCTSRTECIYEYGSASGATHTFQAQVTDAGGATIYSNTLAVSFSPYQPAYTATGFSSQTRLIGTVASRTSDGYGIETIRYNAQLTNLLGSANGITIRVYDELTNTLLATCTNAQECNSTLSSNTTVTRRLYAIATHESGATLTSDRLNLTYGPSAPYTPPPVAPATLSGSVYTSAEFGEVRVGQSVRIDAALSLTSASGAVRVDIYRQDGQLMRTCSGLSLSGTCQATTSFSSISVDGGMSFYAKVTDTAGNTLTSNSFLVKVFP